LFIIIDVSNLVSLNFSNLVILELSTLISSMKISIVVGAMAKYLIGMGG
jgi:hypothetical protein